MRKPRLECSNGDTTAGRMLSRKALAARWECHPRTVDRLKQEGRLPWVDLSCGAGKKVMPRFRLEDVKRFEADNLKMIDGVPLDSRAHRVRTEAREG